LNTVKSQDDEELKLKKQALEIYDQIKELRVKLIGQSMLKKPDTTIPNQLNNKIDALTAIYNKI
jgi:hypothetical protein